MQAHTNRLANETSPYLLQHAHNPVQWYPWGEDAFAEARNGNKLVLVSIGYSACHWCHVMERECFENEEVADIMNRSFICIKVDREEHPDVDQVYMTAVQLMTNRGGWPLNCFTLPDGRPVYGGTYFPRDQWTQLLNDLDAAWRADPARLNNYAARLHEGIRQADAGRTRTAPEDLHPAQLADMVERMSGSFDAADGGSDHAPKFPLPNNYQFLLKYAWATTNAELKAHVDLTLRKMALGGIHDQVGGGFARYSVDAIWKVPHFEKMLYDNAQLVSLYSQAHQASKDPLYADVVRNALAFIERELMSPEGACYSALDADSEGEEGRYYLWTRVEMEAVLGEDTAFASAYYNVDGAARWEEDRNILLRMEDDEAFARRTRSALAEVRATAERVNAKLLAARAQRPRPGLDDKSLTSWNALMVIAWCDAYEAFGEVAWLAHAERTMRLLLTRCRRANGGLWHTFLRDVARINGYLEDHCFSIEALLALYSATFNEEWLDHARALADHAILHFHDEASGLFHFTSDEDPPLIARTMEMHDNVIPASNSSMAKALFLLGELLDEPRYSAISDRMLRTVAPDLVTHPSGYTNWAQALMARVLPYHEIAILGPNALELRKEIGEHFLPNRCIHGSTSESQLPLLVGKGGSGTRIFVCENRTCQAPVNSVNEALQLLT